LGQVLRLKRIIDIQLGSKKLGGGGVEAIEASVWPGIILLCR